MNNGLILVTQSSCGWIVKSSAIKELPFMPTLKRASKLIEERSGTKRCSVCPHAVRVSELFKAFCTDVKRVKGTPNEKILAGALQRLMKLDFPTRWKIIEGSTIIEIG